MAKNIEIHRADTESIKFEGLVLNYESRDMFFFETIDKNTPNFGWWSNETIIN